MIPDIIFWYVLNVVSTILGSFTAFMVLKYLNKKPLGMQTVFDEIIKDLIYLNMLDWLIFVATDIAVRFFAPLNHYAISTIIICKVTVTTAVINQSSILMLIRYLLVFYPTQMDNAHFAKNLTRLFLVYISFTTALLVDKKNTPIYFIATGKNIENSFINGKFLTKAPILFAITLGVCLIIFIFTQYKIEKFDQSVDSQLQDIHVEGVGEENQNSSDAYSKNTYRIAFLILLLLFTSVFTITSWVYFYDIKPALTAITVCTIIKHMIFHNIIPMIFIIRNEHLFSFMKIQILRILKCKCRNNQIEPMIELNVL